MDLPLGAVARALDLPTAERPIWISWLSVDQLGVIEAATGAASSVVEAMTLSVYDGTAPQLATTSAKPRRSTGLGLSSRSASRHAR
jgi:hypothetical protein